MSKNYRQLKRPESVKRQFEGWAGNTTNRARRKTNRLMYQAGRGYLRHSSSRRYISYHHAVPDFY